MVAHNHTDTTIRFEFDLATAVHSCKQFACEIEELWLDRIPTPVPRLPSSITQCSCPDVAELWHALLTELRADHRDGGLYHVDWKQTSQVQCPFPQALRGSCCRVQHRLFATHHKAWRLHKFRAGSTWAKPGNEGLSYQAASHKGGCRPGHAVLQGCSR